MTKTRAVSSFAGVLQVEEPGVVEQLEHLQNIQEEQQAIRSHPVVEKLVFVLTVIIRDDLFVSKIVLLPLRESRGQVVLRCVCVCLYFCLSSSMCVCVCVRLQTLHPRENVSGSRCAAQPVKIFTEIIGNWRKVEIFNRIEKISAVKQQRQEECLGES